MPHLTPLLRICYYFFIVIVVFASKFALLVVVADFFAHHLFPRALSSFSSLFCFRFADLLCISFCRCIHPVIRTASHSAQPSIKHRCTGIRNNRRAGSTSRSCSVLINGHRRRVRGDEFVYRVVVVSRHIVLCSDG